MMTLRAEKDIRRNRNRSIISFFFGTTTDIGQPTSEVSLAFSDLLLPLQDSQFYVWEHGLFGAWTHDGLVIESFEFGAKHI